MGRVLTLEISNMDKISIFDTTLVLEFMPYIHFCPKTSLPSMIFSNKTQGTWVLRRPVYPISTGLIQFWQVWSNLDRFDPIPTSLIQFGQVWSSLDKFDPIWTSPIQFGQVWSNLDRFDPIWTSLIQFGHKMYIKVEKATTTTMTITRSRDGFVV